MYFHTSPKEMSWVPVEGLITVTFTGALVSEVPPESVPTAVNEWPPGEAVLQVKVNGYEVSSPILEGPSKNSTLLMLKPVPANASAESITSSGNRMMDPFAGVTRLMWLLRTLERAAESPA